MKIIFLDIDGVLNSEKSMRELYNEGGLRLLNDYPAPEHVKWLNKIISKTGAKIVVTSTWRKLHNFLSLLYIFHLCNIEGELIGTTLNLHKRRGYEIQDWLDNSGYTVESFVILDDDSDMEHLMDYLVKTDTTIGLTEKEADKAIEILL